MNIFELMESRKNTFSATDRKIYENIKKFPQSYAENKISDLVQSFGFSQAALTRFAKRLGFEGFNVFQYQFRLDFINPLQNKNRILTETDSDISPALYYGKYMKMVEDALSDEVVDQVSRRILNCNNLIVGGTSTSSLPAQYLQCCMNLLNTRPTFLYVPPGNGLIQTSEKDIFLLFSVNSGFFYKTCLEVMEKSEHSPYRILVTVSSRHTLRKYFDQVIVLPETNLAQTTHTVLPDTLAFLLFCDSLNCRIHNLMSKINESNFHSI